MKFVPVNPEDFPNYRESARGRVSFPIVKAFLESNIKIAKMDRTGIDRSPQYLKMLLSGYCRAHKIPIKLVTRQGELYFIRLDLDENGNKIDWSPEDEMPPEDTSTAKPLTDEEIAKH